MESKNFDFGYLEHPDISKFFRGPPNFEISIFNCTLKTHLNLPGIYYLEQNKNSSFIDSEGD